MKKMKLLLAAALLSSMTSSFATENGNITKLLKSRVGFNTVVTDAVETPANGIYQTSFGSKIAYLSDDGRYVFIGDMIDLQTQTNLTEITRQTVSKAAISTIATNDLAVYPAVKDTKSVLNVFTDTSCPYCKKLHEEVPELQKAGIEVRYFPFPRGGARGPGYQTLKQVWCGKDKANTMNIAKDVTTGELPSADCENASFVDEAYALGNQLGVSGTPALFTQNGKKIEGYVPHKDLIPMLLN